MGGMEQLAAYLGVDEALIEQWIRGRVTIPGDVFLKAVDIVVGQPDRKS
jgi:DNA-binding transcriptional regulator YdaS (Cro superfamily)